MPVEGRDARLEKRVSIRPMHDDDVDAADRVLRLAFGTIRRLPDPSAAFADRQMVRTRFRAAPECAWIAEIDGALVGSVFVARWGSFAILGPLTVHPDLWDRGIGGRLLLPPLEAFERRGIHQAGLFTFADSPKHLGLYQSNGFWPGSLTVVTTKETGPVTPHPYALISHGTERERDALLEETRQLTDQVFAGLDLGGEIAAVSEQQLGDTILLRGDSGLDGIAICHCGAGSEAGGDTCYVKFAAVRPGDGAPERFEKLLDTCDSFAAESGLNRLVAGIDTGRRDAYGRLLARGFRVEQVGVSMWLRPDEDRLDTADLYVIDDRR
jgi:GNAT superfamily N-acetyltransferase